MLEFWQYVNLVQVNSSLHTWLVKDWLHVSIGQILFSRPSFHRLMHSIIWDTFSNTLLKIAFVILIRNFKEICQNYLIILVRSQCQINLQRWTDWTILKIYLLLTSSHDSWKAWRGSQVLTFSFVWTIKKLYVIKIFHFNYD